MHKQNRVYVILATALILMLTFGNSTMVSAGKPTPPGPTPTPVPPGPTVVTIGFDDGYADQYLARDILAAHGMQATFFVNTGVVGDSVHMTWEQLSGLYANGNEITGHSP